MMVNLNDFKRETICVYKDEQYSVRDNGAALRHARKGKRLRKYDSQWIFGNPNNNGHLLISSEVIHRIVAKAFHGEPPTLQHIVNHIDTNRQNNRPENLRWRTKLENALDNPITRHKIEFLCGIEAFLKDPSILRNYVNEDPNFEWMRTVTPEEAQISWQRLMNWTKREKSNNSSKVSSLGEWIFMDNANFSSFQEDLGYVVSQTPNSVQKNWKTPYVFPCCPHEHAEKPIAVYADNLKNGSVF